VTVTSGFWGYSATTASPLAAAGDRRGLLFFDGKSKLGWGLMLGGALIIFLGVLMNLRIYFAPTSLFNTLLMLVLLAEDWVDRALAAGA
jgi:hypothetical protein